MILKHILVTSAAAFALTIAGATLAEQPATPLVSGDEPMNVDDSAQIKAPDPSAKAQAKTEEMLKGEAADVSGDMPMNADDSKQIKAPE